MDVLDLLISAHKAANGRIGYYEQKAMDHLDAIKKGTLTNSSLYNVKYGLGNILHDVLEHNRSILLKSNKDIYPDVNNASLGTTLSFNVSQEGVFKGGVNKYKDELFILAAMQVYEAKRFIACFYSEADEIKTYILKCNAFDDDGKLLKTESYKTLDTSNITGSIIDLELMEFFEKLTTQVN